MLENVDVDVDAVQKLEEEMRKKMDELQNIQKELQAESAKPPEELMKKMGGLKDIKAVGEAVREMQDKIREKRTAGEAALKDILKEVESLKGMKEKTKREEDVSEELKAVAVRMLDKKGVLEKAVRELEELRERYSKKFLGKNRG